MSTMVEISHLIKHLSQQQAGDFRPYAYGHVASYDPALHRVTVVIPSLRDENDVPVLSPWMPLGSAAVGSGWGLQYAPVGGATLENPTAGEQVEIHFLDQELGSSLAAHLCFNQVMTPPFTDLKPGEIALKGQGGSFVYIHQNNDIEFNSQGKALITATGDISVTAGGGKKILLTASEIHAGDGGTLQAVRLADGSASTILKAQ